MSDQNKRKNDMFALKKSGGGGRGEERNYKIK